MNPDLQSAEPNAMGQPQGSLASIVDDKAVLFNSANNGNSLNTNDLVLPNGASSAPLSETEPLLSCDQSCHPPEEPSKQINTRELMQQVNAKSACCLLI